MADETENFGRIVYDGRIYDLDKMTSDELKNLVDKVESKGEELEKEYDREMGDE